MNGSNEMVSNARDISRRAADDAERHRHESSRTDAPGDAPPPPETIVIEYDADRQLSINHQPVVIADLESTLRSVFDTRVDKTLFITASGTLKYGGEMSVIDAAKGAGVQRVGIVTEGMRERGRAKSDRRN